MYRITIQFATSNKNLPPKSTFKTWAKKALEQHIPSAELTLRIVTEDEMTHLNQTFRKKRGATNVLSFPSMIKNEGQFEMYPLGDIVICKAVIEKEALSQKKSKEAHYAHMVIHGVLHLLGFDHENKKDAKKMETLEIHLLKTFGFKNPYQTENHRE